MPVTVAYFIISQRPSLTMSALGCVPSLITAALPLIISFEVEDKKVEGILTGKDDEGKTRVWCKLEDCMGIHHGISKDV